MPGTRGEGGGTVQDLGGMAGRGPGGGGGGRGGGGGWGGGGGHILRVFVIIHMSVCIFPEMRIILS